MNLFILGATFEVIGEILIGFAVLSVHKHISKEHKIDTDVLKQIKTEKYVVGTGITFILIGYLIHLIVNL